MKYILFFILSLLLNPLISNGQDIKIDTLQINNFFNQQYRSHRFNGVVLIAQNHKILYKKEYGYANIEHKTGFTDSTKFQIASVSKQFTSFGILILEQEKKLSINDPISKYLEDFPFSKIKIKHLMSHTSGLPNFVDSMWKDLDTTVVNGNENMLAMLKSKKYSLQWEPGSKFEYSDIGYCILATLIEKISGVRFNEFMKAKLFEPAQMKNTTAQLVTDYRKIKTSNLSMGYHFDTASNSMKVAYELPQYSSVYWLGGFYGDGSVVSSIHDLLVWDKALYERKIISEESLKKAMSPMLLNNGKKAKAWGENYGFGWLLHDSPVFGKIETHTGGQPGYSSRLTRCPDKNLTIIILSNMTIPNFWEMNLLKELEKQQ
ncbi:serine hydrolase domain-containing protein [Aquimarina longa]|uniref:serine hydrolase domain-containing protein n=1 Tax=Aquimarina longa TaxID=1080221 RepID=UPI000780AEE9|nr:serine hydrolase [Aquimarina longa]